LADDNLIALKLARFPALRKQLVQKWHTKTNAFQWNKWNV